MLTAGMVEVCAARLDRVSVLDMKIIDTRIIQ